MPIFRHMLMALILMPLTAGFVATARAQEGHAADVKTIIDRRCVVCHSCYDAPCQLKLTSPDGLIRGASKQPVYHSDRLSEAPLTRLGIDAQTEPEWRAMGFHAVKRDPTQGDAPSLLEWMLEWSRQNPLPADAPLPDEVDLALDRPLVCPDTDEFYAFREGHTWAGMPFATAPLADAEYDALMAWARSGATLPNGVSEIPEDITAQLKEWEAFLNTDDLRSQLMSRYLYEHLFLARLHFEGDDPRRFFQVVRSTTPPGEDIDIIATRRPFDDPGAVPFYYRLQPFTETIVHKEHLVYTLGPNRMARYRELFLNPDWTLDTLPNYGEAEGGNPFTTFAAMPAESRYRFLLDDALFFVRSFIRGPVCHGETAVDVIEDRFWVSFLDPEFDLSVTDPGYLREGAAFLELPVSGADASTLSALHGLSHKNQAQYLEFRTNRYKAAPVYQTGFGYDAIWDGDGINPNALITVFRHFDNASAMTGFHGALPETAWVIDYPIFERIYYDLVAGFDVFGRLEHQLATRIYMDELRMESEDTFLAFMPRDLRPDLHKGWYQGALAELHTYWHRRRVDDRFPTGIAFETDDPKQEFLLNLLRRGDGLWPVSDPLNRCTDGACAAGQPGEVLRELVNQTGDWVKFLPDLSVLVVDQDQADPAIYTLTNDRAHTNVAFLFDETGRRDPASDVLTILPGMVGSYPNFFFFVPQDQMGRFVAALKSIRSQNDYMAVVAEFGLRRTSPEFWRISDQLHDRFLAQDPLQAGVLDLNRYKDPKSDDDPT